MTISRHFSLITTTNGDPSRTCWDVPIHLTSAHVTCSHEWKFAAPEPSKYDVSHDPESGLAQNAVVIGEECRSRSSLPPFFAALPRPDLMLHNALCLSLKPTFRTSRANYSP